MSRYIPSRSSSHNYRRNDDFDDSRSHHRDRESSRSFTLSQTDFHNGPVLQRRNSSPPRNRDTQATVSSSLRSSRRRSSSKARGPASQEFYALGRAPSQSRPRTRSTSRPRSPLLPFPASNSSSSARGRSPSATRSTTTSNTNANARRPVKVATPGSARREPSSPRHTSTSNGSKSKVISTGHRSSSSGGGHTSSSQSGSRKRERSSSPPRPVSTSFKSRSKVVAASPSSSRADLQSEVATADQALRKAQKELKELQTQLQALQTQVKDKQYQVDDLRIVLDGATRRQELQSAFLRNDPLPASSHVHTHSQSSSASHAKSTPSPAMVTRGPSKRPCIVDDEDERSDEDEDDDEVEILETVPLKREPPAEPARRSTTSHTSTSTSTRTTRSTPTQPANTTTVMPDHFWGVAATEKLLVQPRIKHFKDGSARKGRHLAFNPVKPDIFATGSDDGGVILWNFERAKNEVTTVVSLSGESFRSESACAESMAWSPDGNRMALAFRDPIGNQGEFAVVRLHRLQLKDSTAPQILSRERVRSKTTSLHSRGISAIAWLPRSQRDGSCSHALITAGADHAVILWDEMPDESYTFRVLHREHRSEVRAVCVHSQHNRIFTSGLDGLVLDYDLTSAKTSTILERRKPTISKINAVLEHPANPHLLLISSVEQAAQSLLLLDLRARSTPAMTLSWSKTVDAKSMSQYVVPRWSPAGFHVSCGSTSGLVNIWDVRVGRSMTPVLPQQSLAVHQKLVYHATWHPRNNALFSISSDRTIGYVTFK